MLRPLALVLLLTIPGALAGWSGHGQQEPDTLHDMLDGWMWTEPDTDEGPGRRIYFNAYPTLGETSVNPNAGLLGSRLRVVPVLRWEAMLGVWKDCNRDGYIGLGERATGAYRAELLADQTVCPARRGLAEPVHHDGTWVREVIAIGRVDPCRHEPDEVRERQCPGVEAFSPQPGVVYDPLAVVWGDIGRPGEAGFEACKVWPIPRGATSGTGGLLRYADCLSEHRLIGLVNTVDNDGALGLAIDDPHHPEESRSLLVHEFPLSPYDDPESGRTGIVQPHAERATFTAWDCSGTVAEVDDPTRPGRTLARVPALQPSVAAAPHEASLVATLDRAEDGLAGDCDPKTPSRLSSSWPSLESPGAASEHTGRDQNDVVLRFDDGSTATPSLALTLEPWGAASLGSRHAAPAGDGRADFALPVWKATASFVTTPQLLERSRLSPVPASHWTFHAYVGDATRSAGALLPSASAGTYGAEACGGIWQGIRGGWACDPDAWWTDAGGDTMPRDSQGAPLGARPLQTYHLRDVDCEDGALARGTPAHASLALLSEAGPCPAPS